MMILNNALHIERLRKTYEVMTRRRVRVYLVNDPVDIFYLTGLKPSRGFLLLKRGSAKLFVDGRYAEHARKKAPCSVDEYNCAKLAKSVGKHILYFDGDTVNFSLYCSIKKAMQSNVKPLYNPVKEARMQKEEGELRALKKSGALLMEAYAYLRRTMAVGMSEQQLAKMFEIYVLQHGGDCTAFDPMIAFNTNTAHPHHRSGATRLASDAMVLMDLGVVVDGYASDMTRTFFWGEVSEENKKIYRIVEEAYAEVHALLVPGAPLASLDARVREIFAAYGLEDKYPHSLGHGVGLDVHELPIINAFRSPKDGVLLENMVFTIEPGLYVPGQGGVRIENTYVMQDNAASMLTEDIV